MKQAIFSTLMLAVLLFSACKKKDNNTQNPPTACNGKNFCMKVDGTQVSEDVAWKVINPDRYRLIWETGSGNNYKNIEVDFYGPIAAGTYTVENSPSGTGKSGFQYFVNDNGTARNIQGTSGTITISSVASDQLSGTFTLTATDGTNNNIQVTEGNFVNVPKQ